MSVDYSETSKSDKKVDEEARNKRTPDDTFVLVLVRVFENGLSDVIVDGEGHYEDGCHVECVSCFWNSK